MDTMLTFMVPFIQLVDVGLKNGKTPKEVADYLTQLFQELSKNMETVEEK